MLWLPLVAMVIASALPFPHNPVSGIAAAQTAQPGSRDSRKPRRDPAARLAAPGGNASRVDYGTAVSGQDRQDYVRSPFHKETSALTAESPAARRPRSSSGGDGRRGVGSDVPVTGRTVQDFSEDNSLPKQEYPGFEDVLKHPQDSAGALLNASTHGAEPLAPSGQLRDAARPGKGPSEESPALDAGLHLERDEMFLDAHPRVLFSPSLSPPEHPPLLLLLETGLPEEDGDADEQEDAHIEGHGDRAIDRSTTTQSLDRPVRREKRSHLVDSRRGERSVCESASNWVINKTSAVDLNGQNVTILQEIQTQRGPIKQYFYETRCGQSKDRGDGGRTRGGAAAPARNTELGLAGAGCLGVDKKQWRSECKEKQSYVRALTRDANSRVGWRWIRIDTSCVCVLLSRTNQGREVLTRKGRG